jgi:hypothetical protein
LIPPFLLKNPFSLLPAEIFQRILTNQQMSAAGFERVNFARINSPDQLARIVSRKTDGFVECQHFDFPFASATKNADAFTPSAPDDKDLARFRGDKNLL